MASKRPKITFTVIECPDYPLRGENHEEIKTLKEALEIYKNILSERKYPEPALSIRITGSGENVDYTETEIMRGNVINVDALSAFTKDQQKDSVLQFITADLIHSMPDAKVEGEVPKIIQDKVAMLDRGSKQKEKMEEIMEKLQEGVPKVFTSDEYKKTLKVMSRFHTYSANNTLLIAMQRPDASAVAGYNDWERKFKRHVKKGAKGIKILAPSPYKIHRLQDVLDPKSKQPVLNPDGTVKQEVVEVIKPAYKVVSTFAYEDTEGEPLPEIAHKLEGTVENFEQMKEILQEVSTVPIEYDDIPGSANGYYDLVGKKIKVQADMSEQQTIKTLIHEIAHSILHDQDTGTEKDEKLTSRDREVQAESVAYVTCNYFGIDTSDYSFGYIAGWSKGREIAELKNSLAVIQQTADMLIMRIDNKLNK